ncbi:hypothetical protein D3C87_279960 [compost metagenome]
MATPLPAMPKIDSNGRPAFDTRTVFVAPERDAVKARPFVPGMISSSGGFTRPSLNHKR